MRSNTALTLSVSNIRTNTRYRCLVTSPIRRGSDIQRQKILRRAIFGALPGIPAGTMDEEDRVFYMAKTGVFRITIPINGNGMRVPTVERQAYRH